MGTLARTGLALRALRAGRKLCERAKWTSAQLAAYQRRELRSLLQHCAERSPYYARQLASIPEGDELLALAHLPIMDKATLLAEFDRIVTDRRLRREDLEAHVAQVRGDELHLGEFRVLCSGGSSGQRGLFPFAQSDWLRFLSGLVRWNVDFLALTPRLPRRRIAAVAATTPLHMTARMGRTIDVGVHAMLRLDAREPLERLAAQLDAFRPEVLVGYPSIVALLAEEQSAGRLHITPRAVCTTSEVRTDEMEARMVAAWGVAPYNCYASTETGILAVDCDRHRGLHLLTDHTLVEVVDERDRPVPPGTPGHHLVVTSLLNRTLPILRYRLDDLVTLSPEPCACGRPFPLVVGLDGRSDDVLRLPGPEGVAIKLHPLALRSPLASVAGLRQYHIVHEQGSLQVEVVTADAAVPAAVAYAVRAALEKCGAGDVRVDVRRVDAIARHAASGKMKLIESR
ncbi:MAG TPA: AMP-binding protein [Steroidobacteraceae bacterium]|nr:AMP-binding protein [Steroidobacteraceae bacterium]